MRETFARQLRYLLVRSTIAALIAWVVVIVPLPFIPPRTWFAFVLVPIVVFLWICYVGKLLIDTFFYDRYKS